MEKNNNIKIKTNLLLRTADLYIWLKKFKRGILEKYTVLMQNICMGVKKKLLMDGEDIQKITLV